MADERHVTNAYAIFQQQTTVQMGNVTFDGDILYYILGLISTLHTIKQLYTIKKYREQYIDAVGMFYWYSAGLCWKLGILFRPFIPPPKTSATPFYDWAMIEDRVMSIADYYRQYIAEKKEFPTADVEVLVYEMFEFLVNILFSLDLTVEQCLKQNMKKLEHLKNDELKPKIAKELEQIKQAATRYFKMGRPTKKEKREKEILTIGETWNDKENYAEKRKRRPGPRKIKYAWLRTLQKYKEQREKRVKARSGKDLQK